jgi:hypothetical protein
VSDRLVAWLHEQIEEDERVARDASPSPWKDPYEDESDSLWLTREDANHIYRHDPARVLAEVEAKRAIIAECTPEPRPAETDAQLHARFAHPAYEYETTEGPRKAWNHADVPPDGEGWERNTDAGCPGEGWERFDYTEESYWRRRLPDDQVRKPFVHPNLLAVAKVYRDRPGYDEAVKA